MFRKEKGPRREVEEILLDHESRIAALIANVALLEGADTEDSLTPEDEAEAEECTSSLIVVPTWNEMATQANKSVSEDDRLDNLLTQSDCDDES